METKIKPGQRVRVPAGTAVRSTHPTCDRRVVRRSQTVTVHHKLSAWRQNIAHSYVNEDGSWRTVFEGRERDQEALCQRFGLPCRTKEELDASLRTLLSETTAESPYAHGHVLYHWLEIEPEKVVWAGSSGYWCEVEADSVELL